MLPDRILAALMPLAWRPSASPITEDSSCDLGHEPRSHPDRSTNAVPPKARRRRRSDLVALGAGALAAPAAHAVDTEIQIIATNDFHGRILDEGAQAGAAKLAGAVDALRAANPNTVFAAAGDLIGASTFESFIQNDKPTIDALNAAGLEVSAVGNHELDQGYDDLVNRVMADYNADTNPYGGAEWQYIAANLKMRADRGAGRSRDVDQGVRRRPGRLRRCGDGRPSDAS